MNVSFLDIYHGDCAVITLGNNEKKSCIVIDGGETKSAALRLATYLKYEKIELIDLIIATHIDSDHINGLNHFLKSYADTTTSWNKKNKKCIKNYWGPKPDPNYNQTRSLSEDGFSSQINTVSMTDIVIKSIQQNQDLSELVAEHIINKKNIYFPSVEDKPPLNLVKELKIDFFAPDIQILDTEIENKLLTLINLDVKYLQGNNQGINKRGKLDKKQFEQIIKANAEHMAEIADRTANNQSIVVKITPKSIKSKNWSFLFSGDAEKASWDMIESNIVDSKFLKSRVLKVPHHGSVNGMNSSIFSKINPDYCIVSAGQKHGLPDESILNLIKNKKSRNLFCTERNKHLKKPGPCNQKFNCPRRDEKDFRSLRFSIDLNNGNCKIDTFKFSSNNKEVLITNDEPWCPETSW